MVFIDMCISNYMNELPSLKSNDLSNHASQQCITCNIKWNSKPDISRSLIELARQLPIIHIKLRHHMARRKSHFWYIRHIPCIQYDSSRIWVFLQSLNNLGQLVHPLTLVIRVIINIGSSEVSPLEPIHRS